MRCFHLTLTNSAVLQAGDNIYFCFCHYVIVKIPWLRNRNTCGSRNLRIQRRRNFFSMSGTFLSTWDETVQIQGSKCIIIFCINVFTVFLPFQHLSFSPATTTGSSEDLLSDALISLDVNCSSGRSYEASGLLPYVSLFEGTYSDLELNTEDERRVTPPDSYQNNNAPQYLDQICHLTNTAKCPGLSSDQDLYDVLAEDEVGSFGTFEQCLSNKDDYSKDDSSDFAVDSDIGGLPEEPDGGRDWSPDSLSYQEYDQDSLGKVSSSGAYSLSQPLKMPTSLYSTTDFEDILDPLHIGYGEPHNSNAPAIPTLRSLAQTEEIIQRCLVSQGSSSGDHYFGLELDMQIDLTSDSKPVITDGDHGIMVFDLVPKSSRAFDSRSGSPGLFSDQLSGQPMCEYGGVINDDDFVIEYDSDVAA